MNIRIDLVMARPRNSQEDMTAVSITSRPGCLVKEQEYEPRARSGHCQTKTPPFAARSGTVRNWEERGSQTGSTQRPSGEDREQPAVTRESFIRLGRLTQHIAAPKRSRCRSSAPRWGRLARNKFA